jgi:hypothetical protein
VPTGGRRARRGDGRRCGAGRGGDAPRYRAAHGSGRRARVAAGRARSAHQLAQGLLARGGLHQGGPARLLRAHRAVDAALPARPAPGAHPVPRRHRGQVLLPEGRPRVRARVGPHRADLLPRHRLPGGGRRGDAAHVANSAAIPIHCWASRVPSLERPDWLVLDLDPRARRSPTW